MRMLDLAYRPTQATITPDKAVGALAPLSSAHRKGPLCTSAGAPLEPIVRRAMELLPVSGCAVELHDARRGYATVVCADGDMRDLVGEVTSSTRSHTMLELASSVSRPLVSRGERLGTLGIREAWGPRTLGARERDLLALLTDHAALIAEIATPQQPDHELGAQSNLLQFLSIVSHDLRTPLSSIIGFTNIILEGRAGGLNGLQREFLGLVQLGAQQLCNLVDGLLDVSHFARGDLRLNHERVDLAAVVARHVRQLEPLVAETETRLVNAVRRSIGHVAADPKRLDQVIGNLLTNAIKFTQPGGTVTITGRRRRHEIVLSIIDTGIGIPFEDQEHVFDRFYQVHRKVRGPIDGSGLGLAVCKHIVESHGGRIWVDSMPGEGSSFHFTIPRNVRPRTAQPAG